MAMRVSLFITCLADTVSPAVGRATVDVLERVGCEVSFNDAQTCCGQMHLNTGYPEGAGRLIHQFADTYDGSEVVVTPSGSCAAMLRHHAETVAPGVVMPPVYELSEFLLDVIGTDDVGARFEHTVTYHPTCHSSRLLHVGDRPTRLLSKVQGINLVPLPDATSCCGFGGTFAVKNADTSGAMGIDKVDHAADSGAEYLCASDASCLMHIQGVATKQKSGVRTIHLAEILAAR